MTTPLIERLESLLAGGKDTRYSAAWTLYGKTLADCRQDEEALADYRRGIGIAEGKVDKQAAREMPVFACRIEPWLVNGSGASPSDMD